MQEAVVIRLRPLGPWRFGAGNSGQDQVDSIFRSDRLFSALTLAMQQLDMASEWLDATALSSTPAVTISSLFPYQGDTQFVPPPTVFWPPSSSLLTSSSPVFVSKTRWGAAQFVPLSLVEALLLGQQVVAEQWMVDAESKCLLRRDRPVASPFRRSVRTRAAVDRLTGAAVETHVSSCVEFEASSGLWCVVRFSDGSSQSGWSGHIQSAFRLLADTGFGGHRSSGWGQAAAPVFQSGAWPSLLTPKLARTLQAADTAASDGNESSLFWLLSLYSPAPADAVDWRVGDYRLAIRGGRVQSSAGSGAQKKVVRMVTEGSVVSLKAEPVGTAINVAPEGFTHPVYRSGFALSFKLPSVVVIADSTATLEGEPAEKSPDLEELAEAGCSGPTSFEGEPPPSVSDTAEPSESLEIEPAEAQEPIQVEPAETESGQAQSGGSEPGVVESLEAVEPQSEPE